MNADIDPKRDILNALRPLAEQYGFDCFQVVWSRHAGGTTHNGEAGEGNHFTRARLCEKYAEWQVFWDHAGFEEKMREIEEEEND